MTFRNKIVALGTTLAVLTLAFVLSFAFSPESLRGRSVSGRLAETTAVNETAVIEITKSGTSLELFKAVGSWDIRDFEGEWPVDTGRPEAFLKAISEISELVPSARTKDNWDRFALGDAVSTLVTLKAKDGTILSSFRAGKEDASGNGIYVRKEGNDTVYLVRDSFKSYLETGRSRWADLSVFRHGVKEESVISVKVQSKLILSPGVAGGKPEELLDSFTLTRGKDQSWTSDRPGMEKIDSTKADAMVRALLGFKGEDFAKKALNLVGLETPSATVTATLQDGTNLVLLVGGTAGEGQFWVKSGSSDNVFRASKWTIGNAVKNLRDLAAVK